MIEISNNYVSKRALGWSQDASNFESLKMAVRIFDTHSPYHIYFVSAILPRRITNKGLLLHFQEVLKKEPLRIPYTDLVGTHATPRKASICNGIMQAAIKGQTKPYLSDWAADSFVRWAHLCGFISYDVETDSFAITEQGLQFSASADGSLDERYLLIDALLHYPPVGRILNLLARGENLTKFEIGRNLGFVGEDGFTSLPQNVLLSSLALASPKEKSKMLTDWDGSSDKYARQICKWLEKLGLVKTQPKEFHVVVGNKSSIESISQAYTITARGLKELRKINGVNKVERVYKNVFWEMLCLKGSDRTYIRNRRGYLIKILSETSMSLSLDIILEKLKSYGFDESIGVIGDDIKGLINLGLNVKESSMGYRIMDEINNLVLPKSSSAYHKNLYDEIKDRCREYCEHISHNYLDLIDLAYESTSNRQFEFEVVDLLTSECNFEGMHLGGGRKPDGIIYTTTLSNNYGFIIDTKAYSKGYSLPISQADEMSRYISENSRRDENINSNVWWTIFPENINRFGFIFVSGSFTGSYLERLHNINLTTNVSGSVINVFNLLCLAEDIKSQRVTLEQVFSVLTINNEVIIYDMH